MADLRLYPNLPGVVSSISAETLVPELDDSKPKFLLVGWHSEDAFADGTPILFNEPYFILNSTMLSSMFGDTEGLGLHAKIIGTTSNWELLPVLVRVGKVDIKAGSGADVDTAKGALSQATADGNVTGTVAKVSWSGEPTWKANYTLKVVVSGTNIDVYLNNATEPLVSGDSPLNIEELGLKVEGLADGTEYFAFQYAVEPTTDDEKISALKLALDELIGLEINYVYSPFAVLDDAGTTDHFATVLAEFAEKQSSQYNNVLAYIGVKAPSNYTYSAIKKWVNDLKALMSTGGTFENGIVSSGGADVGHRLVIVAGHGIVENVSNVKVDLASYVGAYLHANKVYTGPINLELTGVTLLESLSLKQVNELSGHRITALYNKPGYNKTPVILVGRTAAPITTPFTKISSIMVVNEFVNGLKNIADTYLGRPNSGTVRMSMQSTMQNFANSMKQAGKIAGAVVTVEPDVTSGTINALAVKARVQAFAEIEVISIDVTFEYQIA